jgi:hypothetical protein
MPTYGCGRNTVKIKISKNTNENYGRTIESGGHGGVPSSISKTLPQNIKGR